MGSCARFVLRYSFLVTLFSFVSSHTLVAQTIRVWTPFIISGNYNWDDASNWVTIGLPSASDIAKFENSTDSVYISTGATVAGLILNGGTIAGTGTITVGDSMDWNGGRFLGSGALTFGSGAVARVNGNNVVVEGWTVASNGKMELASGTSISGSGWIIVSDTLVLSGTVTVGKLELLPTAVITGTGTLEITDSLIWNGAAFTGGGTLRILDGAVLTLSGGTLNGWTLDNDGFTLQNGELALGNGTVTNDGTYDLHGSFLDAGGTNSFTNSATLNVGSGTESMGVLFNTSGTVDIQDGSLNVTNGGSASGNFTIAEGQTVSFTQTNYAFDGPAFSGLGWMIVDDATVSVNVNSTASRFDFSGYDGVLEGSAKLEVTDSMLWGGGHLNGTGELIIGSSATLTTPPGDYLLEITDHTLTVNGRAIQGIWIDAGGNAQLNNNGSYEAVNGGIQYEGISPPVFNNAGLYIHSNIYDNPTEIQILFNNSGSVEVRDGILSLNAGGISSGTFSVVDTAMLVIPSGLYQMNAGSAVSGDGHLSLVGGTLYLGANVVMDKFDLNSGVVGGNGNLTVQDSLLWGSGTLGGGGEVIIPENGSMLITAGLRSGPRNLDARTLNNMGTVVQWADFNVKSLANILNSGTYQLMGNHVVAADTNFGIFHNIGNFEKLAGLVNGGFDGRVEIPFQNDGNLLVEQSASLELTSDFPNLVDRALTGGVYTIHGTFTIPGDIDTNYASITLSGDILNSAGSPALSKFHMNLGGFTLTGETFLTINDSLQNEGTFTIEPGCSLSVKKFLQTWGTTYFLSGFSGGLNVDNGVVDIDGGAFYGNGTIYGGLINSAEVFIGDPVGRLSVTSYQQSPAAILYIDIGGTSPAENHDQLSLPRGLATLDGTVKAKLVDGFIPDIDNRIFEIVEHEGRNGTFDAVVDLDPGDGIRLLADYGSTAVTNLVANFAPVFSQTLPDTTIDENQTLTFSFVGEDPEEASVFYSLVSLVSGASIDSVSGNFSWTPNYDQSGVHEIVLGVSDAFETTLDTVMVTVQHVNRAPFFTEAVSDTTTAEGQELQFTILGTDLDLDVLSFGLEEGPPGASVVPETGLFSWTPSFSDSGSHRIIVSLTDDSLSIVDTVWVEVTNTNILPVFVLGLPDATIDENTTLMFTMTGSDFDLNALTFAKVEGPTGLTVSESGQVEWTTSYDDSGAYQIVTSLFDGHGYALDTATIIVANVNRLPVFVSGLLDTMITEGQSLSYSMTGADPDSDPLTFGLFSGPAGADVSAGGLFTWTPSYSDSGSHAIVVSLGDGFDVVLDTAWIYVSNANIPPVFVLALLDTVIDENTNFTFTMTGSDFDLNALIFAKEEGPAGLTVSENGAVEWTTTYDDSGSYEIIVSLFDGFATVKDTATLVVANVNRLPAFVEFLPDTIVSEAQLLSFSVTATDSDSDSVTFGLVGPDGASISSGGLFTWTPSYSDSGRHAIIISAGDGLGFIKDTAFVTVQNVNRLPVFTLMLSDTTILELSTLSVNLNGTDPDGDVLTFSKMAGPAALTVSTSGTIQWETSYADSGTHELIVSLSDGLDAVSDTALIIVLDVNRPPIFSVGLPDTTVSENQLLEFTLGANDPDGSAVAFSMIAGPAGATLSIGGLFAWTPTFLQAGQDTVIVHVTDGIDAVQDTALLTILNVNRTPAPISLLEPADLDTVTIAIPLTSIEFRWTTSADLDTDDTLYYLVRITGPGLDSTIAVKTDTSTAVDLTGSLQMASEYAWSVRVTDQTDTLAATAGRIFRTSSTITSVEGEGVIPATYALGQNYPNPFNPSTTISFALPARSVVTIQIFNLLGQVVATLVHGEQPAGNHSVTWQGRSDTGASVSSGIYFYRIHAKSQSGDGAEFAQTRRLILLK
ncbi:MAG: Ig-like domain-containing protein [Bacteroidota bacterium]